MTNCKSMAIIMTCFNRAQTTKKCLETLKSQVEMIEGIDVKLYACDDHSRDNTKEVIKSCGIDNAVINGTGKYFWEKGMYVAIQEAMKKHYDYYLMINDDVEFFPDAISTMIESFEKTGESCGISGAFVSKSDGDTTYGGRMIKKEGRVAPNGELQKVQLANWNCFLINDKVIQDIGNIDWKMDYGGDYDYSCKMLRKGYNIFITANHIGYCERNTDEGSFKDRKLPRKKRIKLFFSPKTTCGLKTGLRYTINNIDYLGIGSVIKFLGAYIKNVIVVIFF